MDITHSLITHFVARAIGVWIAFWTPVPGTTLEFVTVYEQSFVSLTNHVLTSITCVLNVHVGLTIQVSEPFQGRERVGVSLASAIHSRVQKTVYVLACEWCDRRH